MPDQIVPITGLADVGVILDTPPVSLPPNAFTNARNVRFRDGAVRKMEGEVDIFEGLTGWFDQDDIGQVHHVAWWPSPNQTTRDSGYYIFVVENITDVNNTTHDVYAMLPGASFDGTTAIGLHRIGSGYNRQGRWQHTLFNGGFTFIINNGQDIPQYITDAEGNTDITQLSLSNLPGWDSYHVNETILNDVYGLDDSLSFATGQLVETGVTEFIVTVNGTAFTNFTITVVNGQNDIVFPSNTLNVGDIVNVTFRSIDLVNVRAAIIRSFGDFLVAGNLVERSSVAQLDGSFPIVRRLTGVVRSSDVAQPGAIPNNWNPFAAGVSTADEFVIADTGTVQDMVALQGNMYLYTNSSISVMRLTGNATIPLAVQPVTDQYGALTTDAVLEYDGKHFVIGSDDIYLFGGHPGSIQSIADQKVRRTFFGRVNPINQNLVNLFTLRFAARDEIWVCFPTVDSVRGESDEAYIWNYRNNTWTIRTLNSVISGDIAPVPGGGVPSAVISLTGQSGTDDVATVAAREIQSLEVRETASVGPAPQDETHLLTFTAENSFQNDQDVAVPRPALTLDAAELIEVTIGDNFFSGPSPARQTYDITGLVSFNSGMFTSGGSRLSFSYETAAESPNGEPGIVIHANEIAGLPTGTLSVSQYVDDLVNHINGDNVPQLTDWTASRVGDNLRLTSDSEGIRRLTGVSFITYTSQAQTITDTGPFTDTTRVFRDSFGDELFTVTRDGAESPFTFIVSTSRNTGYAASDDITQLAFETDGMTFSASDPFNSSTPFSFSSTSGSYSVRSTPPANFVNLINDPINFSRTGTTTTSDGLTVVESSTAGGFTRSRTGDDTHAGVSVDVVDVTTPASTTTAVQTFTTGASLGTGGLISAGGNFAAPTASGNFQPSWGTGAIFSGGNTGSVQQIGIDRGAELLGYLGGDGLPNVGLSTFEVRAGTSGINPPGGGTVTGNNATVSGTGTSRSYTFNFSNSGFSTPFRLTVSQRVYNGVNTAQMSVSRPDGRFFISGFTLPNVSTTVNVPAVPRRRFDVDNNSPFDITFTRQGTNVGTVASGAAVAMFTGPDNEASEAWAWSSNTFDESRTGSATVNGVAVTDNDTTLNVPGVAFSGSGSGTGTTDNVGGVPGLRVAVAQASRTVPGATFGGQHTNGLQASRNITGTSIRLQQNAMFNGEISAGAFESTFGISRNDFQALSTAEKSAALTGPDGGLPQIFFNTLGNNPALTEPNNYSIVLRQSAPNIPGSVQGTGSQFGWEFQGRVRSNQSNNAPAFNLTFSFWQTASNRSLSWTISTAGTSATFVTDDDGNRTIRSNNGQQDSNERSYTSVPIGIDFSLGGQGADTTTTDTTLTVSNNGNSNPLNLTSGTWGSRSLSNGQSNTVTRTASTDTSWSVAGNYTRIDNSEFYTVSNPNPFSVIFNDGVTDTNIAAGGNATTTNRTPRGRTWRVRTPPATTSYQYVLTNNNPRSVSASILGISDTDLMPGETIVTGFSTSQGFTVTGNRAIPQSSGGSVDVNANINLVTSGFAGFGEVQSPVTYQFRVPFTDPDIPDISISYETIENMDRANQASVQTNLEAAAAFAAALEADASFAMYFSILRTADDSEIPANGFRINALAAPGDTIPGTTTTMPDHSITITEAIIDGMFGGDADFLARTIARRSDVSTDDITVMLITGTQTLNNGVLVPGGDVVAQTHAITLVGAGENGEVPAGDAGIPILNEVFRQYFRGLDNTFENIWGFEGDIPPVNPTQIDLESAVTGPHFLEITEITPASSGLFPEHFSFTTTRTGRNVVDTPIYPSITVTSPEGISHEIFLDNPNVDPMNPALLDANGIANIIRTAITDNYTDWIVHDSAETDPRIGTPVTGRQIKLVRVADGPVTGTWSFSTLVYGNTGTTLSGVRDPIADLSTIGRLNPTDFINVPEFTTNLDFRGTNEIRSQQTRVMVRISNPDAPVDMEGNHIQYFPFVLGGRGAYDPITQSPLTTGTREDATNILASIQSGIEQANRRVVTTLNDNTLTVIPSQFSELANFVIGIVINDSPANALEYNRLVGIAPDLNELDLITINEDTDGVQSTVLTPLTGGGSQFAPGSRRPTFSGSSINPNPNPGLVMNSSTVNTVFDPLRPWPTSQVNLNREFPIFATAILNPDDGTLMQHFRGGDIGFLYLREQYESFVERIELALTPEFDTEQLQSLALWGDGGSIATFGMPINQAILDIKAYGTNNPGETRGVYSNVTRDTDPITRQRTTDNMFEIGNDYKIDMRVHGRFLNLLISDYLVDMDQATRTANPMNTANDANLMIPRGISWNISGMQAEIAKGGRR